jgi:hypothetical protein
VNQNGLMKSLKGTNKILHTNWLHLTNALESDFEFGGETRCFLHYFSLSVNSFAGEPKPRVATEVHP